MAMETSMAPWFVAGRSAETAIEPWPSGSGKLGQISPAVEEGQVPKNQQRVHIDISYNIYIYIMCIHIFCLCIYIYIHFEI